jgi:hypothetical protein
MKELFVPHEQSLELRKLEFSEPCLGFYVGKDKEVFISSNDFNAPYQFRLDSKTTFVAPTFSQAFRWFRKTHNLIGLVEGGYDNGKNIFTYTIWDDFKDDTHYDYFSTPEEAELDCLVKLIEIVKNK